MSGTATRQPTTYLSGSEDSSHPVTGWLPLLLGPLHVPSAPRIPGGPFRLDRRDARARSGAGAPTGKPRRARPRPREPGRRLAPRYPRGSTLEPSRTDLRPRRARCSDPVQTAAPGGAAADPHPPPPHLLPNDGRHPHRSAFELRRDHHDGTEAGERPGGLSLCGAVAPEDFLCPVRAQGVHRLCLTRYPVPCRTW